MMRVWQRQFISKHLSIISTSACSGSRHWLRALLFAGGLVVLAGCGRNEAADAPPPPAKPTAGASTQLSTAQKQFLTVESVAASTDGEVLSLPGRVSFRPQAQYSVGAIVPGRVSALLVRSGEAVRAGAALLTIDSSEAAAARASLDLAATRLTNAENTYKRNVVMVEKGVGLEVERQEAETRFKEARSEYERARHGVDLLGAGKGIQVTVRAPSDGIVMSIRASVGAVVAPGGEALLELGDSTRLQIVAQVAETELRRIAVGQESEIELPALAMSLPARVESINPRVNAESRRAQVYLALSRRVDGLRDGMLAQVSLRVSGEQDIMLPMTAVLIKDGKRRIVYVEQADGSFQARQIQTGRNWQGRVAVLSGLTAGDRVVVRGALLLDSQAEQLL